MSESLLEKQRDILFDACKKVATNNLCPEWISKILRNAVMEAKNVKEDFPEFTDKKEPINNEPIKIGDIVIVNNNGITGKVEIVEETDTIQNIRLFTVKVIEQDKYHNVGQLFHQIPETFMKRV